MDAIPQKPIIRTIFLRDITQRNKKPGRNMSFGPIRLPGLNLFKLLVVVFWEDGAFS
ncbi:hypothetical protein [Desulfosarcina variabilis]|uniref:hypothetical protein n=1 Tax=Desulfosarcina variabilis TaxID=2300 RepID=UPI003AFB4067